MTLYDIIENFDVASTYSSADKRRENASVYSSNR